MFLQKEGAPHCKYTLGDCISVLDQCGHHINYSSVGCLPLYFNPVEYKNKGGYTCWRCNLVICYMTKRQSQLDPPWLGSSVVEHLVYIQEAWVQPPVWPKISYKDMAHRSNPSQSSTGSQGQILSQTIVLRAAAALHLQQPKG